ncbi:MAG: prepilin-type N-terminal cleavage/methylation domain-containing protein [Elusimicrobiota bacterium]|jgi:prepilin-type N-terminal cleavage/methylation domain-containing protein
MRKGRAFRGFTLIELVVSMFLFSMVAIAIAAIYLATMRQSTSMTWDARLQGMSALTMRSIQHEVARGAWITEPADGAYGTKFTGWTMNFGVDSASLKETNEQGVEFSHWFHYCIQDTEGGLCLKHDGSASWARPPCLFYYQGKKSDAVPAACGGDGANRELLATNVDPATPDKKYFSREATSKKSAQYNQVRVNYVLTFHGDNVADPDVKALKSDLSLTADSSFQGQMSRTNLKDP